MGDLDVIVAKGIVIVRAPIQYRPCILLYLNNCRSDAYVHLKPSQKVVA